jgi:preprotein translocase subunit SecY
MLSAFANSWKIPELRKRILFTIMIVAFARLGANIPCPGVDPEALVTALQEAQKQAASTTVFGFADLLTGGGLQKCAVFALGVMPYISASIIMMLLTAVLPALERLKREGESGRAKIIQYSRYLTVLICVFQAGALAVTIQSPERLKSFLGVNLSKPLVEHPGVAFVLLTVVTITAGTLLLMWMGEQITAYGIGNGMSLIITVGIVERFPQAIYQAVMQYVVGQGEGAALEMQQRVVAAVLLVVMALAVIAGVIAMTQAQRKIPVQYAKRMVGRKMLGGGQTFMPLRVNYSGVMPIIFAQAILSLPATLIEMSGFKPLFGLASALAPGGWLHVLLFTLMIFFFSYFWVATQFNPLQIADDLKKYGGYIPGIRPGKPTAEFLDFTMTRLTLAGSVFLTVIALIPEALAFRFGVPFTIASFFGGTSMLIIVGVMLDTMRQVESHLVMRHYDGFLRQGRLRGRR